MKKNSDANEPTGTSDGYALNASAPGVYTMVLTNLDGVDSTIMMMAAFSNCNKFSELVTKDHMADVNRRADVAVSTLYHNILELEQSESRLNRRKECRYTSYLQW